MVYLDYKSVSTDVVSGRREKRRAPAVSWRQRDAAENGGQRPEGRLPSPSFSLVNPLPVVT